MYGCGSATIYVVGCTLYMVYALCMCIQHRMTKMVRKYLSKKHVIQEEDLLEKIADSTDRSEHLCTQFNFMYIHVYVHVLFSKPKGCYIVTCIF